MMQFRTILCPTDFSSYSASALRYACALARDCSARLIVLHAMEPAVVLAGEGAIVPTDIEELRDAARKQLNELRPMAPEIHVEKVLREGAAPSTIMDAAREFSADLIVMGTHGRTGLGRLLMGSVTEQVLRRAPCPVLTVRESAAAPPAERELATAGRR